MSAGGHSYLQPRHNKLHVLLLLAALADAVFAAATPPTTPRIGPFLRICLLANRSSDIRREVELLARLIPGLASVLLLVLMTLSFFAFFGLVLFHDISPHYFGTFGRGMWQLWVLMTTSNFPDVRPDAFAPPCRCHGPRLEAADLLPAPFTTNESDRQKQRDVAAAPPDLER